MGPLCLQTEHYGNIRPEYSKSAGYHRRSPIHSELPTRAFFTSHPKQHDSKTILATTAAAHFVTERAHGQPFQQGVGLPKRLSPGTRSPERSALPGRVPASDHPQRGFHRHGGCGNPVSGAFKKLYVPGPTGRPRQQGAGRHRRPGGDGPVLPEDKEPPEPEFPAGLLLLPEECQRWSSPGSISRPPGGHQHQPPVLSADSGAHNRQPAVSATLPQLQQADTDQEQSDGHEQIVSSPNSARSNHIFLREQSNQLLRLLEEGDRPRR